MAAIIKKTNTGSKQSNKRLMDMEVKRLHVMGEMADNRAAGLPENHGRETGHLPVYPIRWRRDTAIDFQGDDYMASSYAVHLLNAIDRNADAEIDDFLNQIQHLNDPEEHAQGMPVDTYRSVFKRLVKYARMTDGEKAKEKQRLNKIYGAHLESANAKAKAAFQEYVRQNNVIIEQAGDLLDVVYPDDSLWLEYKLETWKSWYKEAMPDIKLKSGNPRKR